jgi:uncharacterized glyoxalase superfamily protein PhnB
MHTDATKELDGGLDAIELAASLTVRDLPTSVAWYRDVSGFTIDRRHEREGRLLAVSLRAGRVRLLLTQDDGVRGEERITGAGFSLQLTTAQDIDSLAAAMQARGGALESPPFSTPWGARAFRFSDPDGFRFTISSPVTP